MSNTYETDYDEWLNSPEYEKWLETHSHALWIDETEEQRSLDQWNIDIKEK